MKAIILQGIPASGKSTWARKFIKGKKDWVIINRDSIRNMLGEYWVPSREHLVTYIEHSCIDDAAKANYNVIIDATNLNKSFLTDIKTHLILNGYVIEFRQFDVNRFVCIYRDFKRSLFGGHKVGYRVILNMYNKYVKI